MAFMDYLPTLGSNTDQTPDDATLQQINLKRQLALADSLRNTPELQGQMVGNRYVAPSWTQSLANVANKYIGNKIAEKSMKDYGAFQQSEKDKTIKALKEFGQAFEPKNITNTEMQATEVPLTQGMNVPTSPFGTNEQVNQVAPNYGNQAPVQNMSGNTTQMNPVTTTSTVQPTMSDIEKAYTNLATSTNNPKLLEDIYAKRYEKMMKANEPIKLSAGEAYYSPTGTKLFGNPKEETPGSLEKDYTFAKAHGYQGSIEDFQRIKESFITPYQKQQLDLEKKKLNPLNIPDLSTSSKPLTNNKGWTLHTDANGNQAYVSPDGKNYEEIH